MNVETLLDVDIWAAVLALAVVITVYTVFWALVWEVRRACAWWKA